MSIDRIFVFFEEISMLLDCFPRPPVETKQHRQQQKTLEKTLILGNIESRRRKGQQRMRLLDGITDSMDMSLSKL